jgi:peptidyl-prolyl cis-trans isomerase C
MVRNEMLAMAAAKKNYDRDPKIVADAKRSMATRLLEDEFGDAAVRKQVSDEDLRAFYDKHREEFERPPRLRASIIFFAAPVDETTTRSNKRALAMRVLNEIGDKGKTDPLAFGAIARMRSEDPATRAADGDMRFLTRDEIAMSWGAAVADAAFALHEPGKMSEIIETPKGFAIVKIQNTDPGLQVAFDQNKEELRSRAAQEKRAKLISDYTDALKQVYGLRINAAALQSISADLSAEATPTAQPAH